MNGKATVFVIDDDPGLRDQLSVLSEREDVDVEWYSGGDVLVDACRCQAPGCAIVSLDMPGMDGLQLQAELRQRGIPLPIIFLTGHGDIPTSVRAIKAGAFDFMAKPVVASELLASVQAALDESERVSQRIDRIHDVSALLDCLTEREREVLHLAVEGLANKVIARKLGISHRTVEIHRAHIMHKTGADSLLDLVRLVEACPESSSIAEA